jgi:hypothetical protein
MTRAAKPRIFLLLLATFTTLLALTPPKAAQACYAINIYSCSTTTGRACSMSVPACSQYNTCDGTQVNCRLSRYGYCC